VYLAESISILVLPGLCSHVLGKGSSNMIGKKYAVVKDIDTGEILTLDEWPQHVKNILKKKK
jgi:hypothetical protein